MLNVGPLELLVVVAVALIVVGPERLPELARSVGRALRQFRDVQDEVRDMVRMGVDDEMRQAAADVKADVKKATGDLTRATDVKGAVRKVQEDVRAETGSPGSRRRSHVERAEPTSPRPGDADTPVEPIADEPAGPPADRLVDDGAAATPEPTTGHDAHQEPVPDDPGASR